MKFEVIYEQTVKNQTLFELEAANEQILLEALEAAEKDLYAIHGEDFYDLRRAMENQPELEILRVTEEYDYSQEAPEYYDHNEVK